VLCFEAPTAPDPVSTVIGMAQDFVGANNINLLEPSGQFGTRLTGGSDAASPRYIFTRLRPVARKLFPKEDDILLDYLEEEGDLIEPRFFCPIIPLLLVNGTQGRRLFMPSRDFTNDVKRQGLVPAGRVLFLRTIQKMLYSTLEAKSMDRQICQPYDRMQRDLPGRLSLISMGPATQRLDE
jgi:DNA gyrase/topoisomerase IV, subunit A